MRFKVQDDKDLDKNFGSLYGRKRAELGNVIRRKQQLDLDCWCQSRMFDLNGVTPDLHQRN